MIENLWRRNAFSVCRSHATYVTAGFVHSVESCGI